MINYDEIGLRLSVAVRESPGNNEADPAVRDYYRKANAQRIWELWMQTKMFDPRDRKLNFQQYSGLPDGVVNRYMEVCRKYEEDRATERVKKAEPKLPNQK